MRYKKVTRQVSYSNQRLESGQYVARYSIQVDGKEVMTEFVANSESAAQNGARKRYDKWQKTNLEPSQDNSRLANSQAAPREDPLKALQRNAEDSENPSGDSGSQKATKIMAQSMGESPPTEDRDSPTMTKGKPKNHVPWDVSWFGLGDPIDGAGNEELVEPNPEPFLRPGDNAIRGANNTLILLGRDHAPHNSQIYSKDINERDYNSGFSDHMGAGAIDIVAGRMAPFPLEETNSGADLVLAPIFNTSYPPEVQGYSLEGGTHPGMIMDAARIYISQMTTIDENFRIVRALNEDHRPSDKIAPTSAIMLKSDKIRVHSRQDIKIVTGGPFEEHNSQGNLIKRNHGIHLIAQNGIDREGNRLYQQPIPLGDNLVKCLDKIQKQLSDLNQSVDAFVSFQMKYNAKISESFQFIPIPGPAITAGNPLDEIVGVLTNLQALVKTRWGSLMQEFNNFNVKTTYLDPSNENYINSSYNTVN